jgi:hypothetical protein
VTFADRQSSLSCPVLRRQDHLGNLRLPGSHLAAKKSNWCPVAPVPLDRLGWSTKDAVFGQTGTVNLDRSIRGTGPHSSVWIQRHSLSAFLTVEKRSLPSFWKFGSFELNSPSAEHRECSLGRTCRETSRLGTLIACAGLPTNPCPMDLPAWLN